MFEFSDMSLMTTELWIAYVAVNSLILGIVLLVWSGRNSARFIYAGLMFFELCKRIWFISVIWNHHPDNVAIAVATALTEVAVIVLLLHKRSAAWCREVGAWKIATRA